MIVPGQQLVDAIDFMFGDAAKDVRHAYLLQLENCRASNGRRQGLRHQLAAAHLFGIAPQLLAEARLAIKIRHFTELPAQPAGALGQRR